MSQPTHFRFFSAVVVLVLLAAVLPQHGSVTRAAPSTSSSSSSFSSSLASLLQSHRVKRQGVTADCNNNMKVSAVCYNCAALSPKEFHTIHSRCCQKAGPVRELCQGWYTEDPAQEGHRVKYF